MAKKNDAAENTRAVFGGNSEAGAKLLSYIERIENLDEQARELAEDKKEIKAEIKGHGFDVKTVMEIIKIRRQDAGEREEKEQLLELYLTSIGMIK